MERPPAVFLSSTFFDLRQVRADLRDFVETTLGYRLVASEFSSFPVDPTVDTIENCWQRVGDSADLLILIIGNRYGSMPAGVDRSITNIEYLTARAHGVPVFTFVHRDVLALLPIWQANPDADYSSVVDTPKLFDFVMQVRAEDRVWSFSFDTAQDIIATLRSQWAYQMRRGLAIIRSLGRDAELAHLRGEALRIALEGPKAWQSLLLAELVEQALREHETLRRDHDTAYRAASGEHLSDREFFEWVIVRTREIRRISDEFVSTMNDVLNSACRSGDTSAITYAASRLAACYREALNWAARVRSVHVSPIVEPPAILFAKHLDRVIQQLQGFPATLRSLVAEMLNAGATSTRFTIALDIDDDLTTAFNDALEKASDEVVRHMGTA